MKNNLIQTELDVNNNKIRVMRINDVDYILITDLAKYSNSENPANVIIHWMSNKGTFDYIGLWEQLNNENFNFTEFSEIKNKEVWYASFTLSTEFKLYLIKEFERLKRNETYQEKIEWSVRRSLSKTNYRIHTDSIKENLVPTLTEKQKLFVYANEADVINVALFGMTAKEWRENNIGQKDRLEKLNETAKRQITILASDNNIMGITKLDNQKLIGGVNE